MLLSKAPTEKSRIHKISGKLQFTVAGLKPTEMQLQSQASHQPGSSNNGAAAAGWEAEADECDKHKV